MTLREKMLIDAYIPSPRDESLGAFEYYVEDLSGRIQKVEITDIFYQADEAIYLVVQSNSRRRVKGLQSYGGFTKGHLYDNKEDCRNYTHNLYSGWEKLRELQKERHNETNLHISDTDDTA